MTRYIPLTKGSRCAVSEEDYAHLTSFGSWCTQVKDNGARYAVRTINYKHESGRWTTRQLKMHDVIAVRAFGDVHDGMLVDHINHDTLDNTRENLRLATRAQNQANRRKNAVSASRFKGVSWDALKQKWRVRPTVNGKKTDFGYFTDEQQAAEVYARFIKEACGEFACTESTVG
jgi:HNH endonuclease